MPQTVLEELSIFGLLHAVSVQAESLERTQTEMLGIRIRQLPQMLKLHIKSKLKPQASKQDMNVDNERLIFLLEFFIKNHLR